MRYTETMEGTPEQLAARLKRLPHGKRYRLVEVEEPTASTDEEIAQADARLLRHKVHLGYATGLDNESIDADLAREYGDNHTPLSKKG